MVHRRWSMAGCNDARFYCFKEESSWSMVHYAAAGFFTSRIIILHLRHCRRFDQQLHHFRLALFFRRCRCFPPLPVFSPAASSFFRRCRCFQRQLHHFRLTRFFPYITICRPIRTWLQHFTTPQRKKKKISGRMELFQDGSQR